MIKGVPRQQQQEQRDPLHQPHFIVCVGFKLDYRSGSRLLGLIIAALDIALVNGVNRSTTSFYRCLIKLSNSPLMAPEV